MNLSSRFIFYEDFENQHFVDQWSTFEAYYFKRALKEGFLILSLNIFLALNSRNITMLWVLTLFGFLKKCLKRLFFDTQSWQVVRLSHDDSVVKITLGSEISMKTFFSKKHVLHHPETVEQF